MVRTEVVQGSPAWHTLRRFLITASNVGSLACNESARKTQVKLWEAHEPPPPIATCATEYGQTCEPHVKQLYHDHVEPLTDFDGGFWLDDRSKWLAASPDAIAAERVVEIKCPYAKIVPAPTSLQFKKYAWQVFTQMHVTGIHKGRLVFWVPETLDGPPVTEFEHLMNRRIRHVLTMFDFVYDREFEKVVEFLDAFYHTHDASGGVEFDYWRPDSCTTQVI